MGRVCGGLRNLATGPGFLAQASEIQAFRSLDTWSARVAKPFELAGSSIWILETPFRTAAWLVVQPFRIDDEAKFRGGRVFGSMGE